MVLWLNHATVALVTPLSVFHAIEQDWSQTAEDVRNVSGTNGGESGHLVIVLRYGQEPFVDYSIPRDSPGPQVDPGDACGNGRRQR